MNFLPIGAAGCIELLSGKWKNLKIPEDSYNRAYNGYTFDILDGR